ALVAGPAARSGAALLDLTAVGSAPAARREDAAAARPHALRARAALARRDAVALHAAARDVAMRFRRVPARQGARWVREGLRIFMRRPLAFCVLFLIYLLAGSMLMLAVAPLASLGFMIATRQALAGRLPTPGVFIEPLRLSSAQRWAQVKLGLGYAI